ncbi:MAG: hypothetical protein K1X88_12785 [Nannocystaceae bacterium]|nr:hypothetical protein [Nannocystaceae bacterium]
MNANERPRLLQAVAIVDHGTLALDPVVRGDGVAGIEPGIDVARAPAHRGGGLYPNKPPGASLVAALAYALQRAGCALVGATPTLAGLTWLARLLGATLPTVLLAWSLARRSGDDAFARAAAAITIVATPLVAYAHVLFGHSLAALLLWLGVVRLHDALGRDDDVRGAAIAGALAASAVLVEYGAVIAALPIAWIVVVGFRAGRRRAALAAVVGALGPMALLAAYHATVFGSPWSTGYHHVVDRGFAEIHGRGLLGLHWPELGDVLEDLFSPWGGLLYFAPLVVAAPLAWRAGAGWDQRGRRLQLLVLLAFVLLTLGLEQGGGWRVGPRYLVAALPMMAPALAWLLRERVRSEGALALVLGVTAFAVVVDGLAASLFPQLVPGGNPLRDQLVPLLLAGRVPYGPVPAWLGGTAIWAVIAGLAAVALPIAQTIAPARRVAVFGGALVIAAVALTVAWVLPSAEDAEQTRSGIASIWEPGGERAPRSVPLR